MKMVDRRDNSDIQTMIIYALSQIVLTFLCQHFTAVTFLNKFIAIVHLHLMLFLDAMHRDGQLFIEVVLTYVCQGYS